MLAPEFEQFVPGDQPLVVVGGESAGLEVDDPLQAGAGVRRREHLVDLLLVLGEVHGGAAVSEQVLDLGRRVGRIQADGDGPHGHGGDVEDHPLRPILGMDRHPVARLDAEGEEGVGGVEHIVPDVIPGELLPDAEVLLAHRHLVRCPTCPVAGE